MKKIIILIVMILAVVSIGNATVLSGCQTGLSGDSYTLTSNITSDGTLSSCLEITGSNVEIDCNGNYIIGNQSGTVTQTGVEIDLPSSGSNITVKNCLFSDIDNYMIWLNSGKSVNLENVTAFNNTQVNCGDDTCYGFFYGSDFNITNVNVSYNNMFDDSETYLGSTVYLYDYDGYASGINTIAHNVLNSDFDTVFYLSARYDTSIYNIFDNNVTSTVDSSYCIRAGASKTENIAEYNFYDNNCKATSMYTCFLYYQDTDGSIWNSYRNVCNATDIHSGRSGDCINGIENDFHSINDSCIGFDNLDSSGANAKNVTITNLYWDNDMDGVGQYHTIFIPDSSTCDFEIESLGWNKLNFDGMWSPLNNNPYGLKLQSCTGGEYMLWNISYTDQDIPNNYYNSSGRMWVSDSEVDQTFYQKWKQTPITASITVNSATIDESSKTFVTNLSGDESSMIYFSPYVQSNNFTIDIVKPRINKTHSISNKNVTFEVNTNNVSSTCQFETSDGFGNQTMIGAGNYVWTYTNDTAMPFGNYTVTFWCNDTNGNWHSNTRDFKIGTNEDVYECIYDMEDNITYNLKVDLEPDELYYNNEYGYKCMTNEFSSISDGYNVTINGEGHVIRSLPTSSNLISLGSPSVGNIDIHNLSLIMRSTYGIYISGADNTVIHDIKLASLKANSNGQTFGLIGNSNEIYNIVPYNDTVSTGSFFCYLTGCNMTIKNVILRHTNISYSGSVISLDSNDVLGVMNKIYNFTFDNSGVIIPVSNPVFSFTDTHVDVRNITLKVNNNNLLKSTDSGGSVSNVMFNATGQTEIEDDLTYYSGMGDSMGGLYIYHADTHNLSWNATNMTFYPTESEDYITYNASLGGIDNTNCKTQTMGFFDISGNMSVIKSTVSSDVYPIFKNLSLVIALDGTNESDCVGDINISYPASFLVNPKDSVLFLNYTNITQDYMSVNTTSRIFRALYNSTQPISKDGATVVAKLRMLGVNDSDGTAPSVTLNTPINTTYTSVSTLFNVTAIDETAMSTCWYSLDSATNITMENFSGDYWNATNSSMTQGLHHVQFYCNDTSDNWNGTESVYFTIDSSVPEVTINSPTNITYWNKTMIFNVTSVDATSSIDKCLYELDGNTNITMENFSDDFYNATNSSMTAGLHHVQFYCNDTANNWNGTENVYFTINNTFRNITSCMTLDIPNCIYEQQSNLSNTQAGEEFCLNVSADNVTILGNGFRIDGNDAPGTSYGIYTSNNNTMIKDVYISDYYVAAIRTIGDYTTVFSSDLVSQDGGRGFSSLNGDYFNVSYNDMTQNKWAISLESGSTNGLVEYNNMYNQSRDYFVYVNGGSNHVIQHNNMTNGWGAMKILNSATGIVIFDNNMSSMNLTTSKAGIEIVSGSDINITKNIIKGYDSHLGGFGIYLDDAVHDVHVENNTISKCYNNINIKNANNDVFIDNSVSDAIIHNIYITTGCNNSFTTTNVTNGTSSDIYVVGTSCTGKLNTFNDFYQNTTHINNISYDPMIAWKLKMPSLRTTLTGWEPIGDYYFDLLNESTSPGWVYMNISYVDSDVGGNISESSIKFFKNLSGSWSSAVGTPNTVDVTDNWIYANISNFGGNTFVPMGDAVYNSTYSNYSVNDTAVSHNTNISVTVENLGYLGGCIIEHNNSGTWVNESFQNLSGTSALCSQYPIRNNDTNLMVIGYYVWVNDTDNVWTRSPLQTYTLGSSGSGGGGSSNSAIIKNSLIYEYDIHRKDGRNSTYDSAWKIDNVIGFTSEDNVIQFAQIVIPSSDIGTFIDMDVYFTVPKSNVTSLNSVKLYQLSDTNTWNELDVNFQRDVNDSYYFVSNTDDMGKTFVIAYEPIISEGITKFIDIDAKVVIIAGLAFLGLLILMRKRRMI